MRNHHHIARETFLEWRRSGSPREGPEAYRMREARATFKRALRECRREEARMREEALAAKLADKDMSSFWQLANSKNKVVKPSSVIDDVKGPGNIAEVWRSKFHEIFNSLPGSRNLSYDECCNRYEFITQQQIKAALSRLATNKAVGADGIPAEVVQAATGSLLRLITIITNALLRHRYVYTRHYTISDYSSIAEE